MILGFHRGGGRGYRVTSLLPWEPTLRYPSYNATNPNLGTAGDLQQLSADARRYNTILSYHINVDEAYKNFTATQGLNFSVCGGPRDTFPPASWQGGRSTLQVIGCECLAHLPSSP